ncbi:MAG: cytochrome C [Candidatus Saccharibacteria bacterium]
MKKLKKIALWTIGILLFFIGATLLYLKLALPNVGTAPKMKVEITTERVARGQYLANHVTVCIDCHSQRDWTRFSGPPKEGTFGMGGDLFDQKFGFPGTYYAKNITPAGLKDYTDGELFRAITTGVDRKGRALFPVMPAHYYGQMDIEDVESIIAYIRTLRSIENQVPQSKSDFPMNFLINTIPHKASFTKRPDKTDVVNYGRYLTNAASCVECHTKFEKGSIIAGREFGGGREFPFPDGSVVISANITPDAETGIGGWNEDVFVNKFRARVDSVAMNAKVNPGEFNSIMPWTMYGNMNEEDLKAIFAYLKTVKPIKNQVEKFKPAMAQSSQ